jgi:hypothetical protein
MAEINEILAATYTLKEGETAMSQHGVAALDPAAEGQVVNPAGEGAGVIAGVLRDASLAAGATGSFQVAGIAKVKIAEAVSIGDLLIVADAQGRVKPKGTGAHASGTGIVGRALSSANTAGSIVKCILCIPGEFSS